MTHTPLSWWRRLGERIGWIGPRRLARLRVDTERADSRQQMYAKLLGMVASAFVELDEAGRVRRMARRGSHGRFRRVLLDGQTPLWELPGMVMEEHERNALLEHLTQRSGCENLSLSWQSHDDGVPARHMVLDVQPRRDADDVVIGFWGLLRDVSTQVQTLQALADTEGRFYDLFYRMPSALLLHRDMAVVDANPAAIAMFGYTDLHSMLGRNLLANVPAGPVRDRLEERLKQLNGLPVGASMPQSEYPLAIGGEQRIVSVRSVRVLTADGLVTLSIIADETAQRHAMDAVAQSQELLSLVVAASPDIICLIELGSEVVKMVNRTFERMTGYRSDDVIGRSLQQLGFWVEPEAYQQAIDEVRAGQALPDKRVRVRMADGSIRHAQWSAAVFRAADQDYLVSNIRDVSDSEQARLEYEAILSNASIGIALSRSGYFQRANPRLEAMLGWAAGDLIGQPEGVLWAPDAGGGLGTPQAKLDLLQGEAVELEQQLRRRDGSTFLGRVLARAINPSEADPGGLIWLIEDVTERRQIDRALAKARDDAEAASRAKSAFLATTSHEIRTPLNALLGLARLARQPQVDEAQRREYIDHICDSAETLSVILSDILDLSKIEAGKLHIEQRPFDLRVLLKTLHDAYGTLADVSGLALTLQVGEDVPQQVVGDGMRLRQILSNYLTNALKFTRVGQISIAVEQLPDQQLLFSVSDTGVGIAEQDRVRLFLPFSRGDNVLAREVGGTGLGLSICRELAGCMGGEVGVESQAGVGSRFWLRLPLSQAQPADELVGEMVAPAVQVMRPHRVLIVEDNPVNMMIAASMLQQWGYCVTQAADGRAAIESVDAAARAGEPFAVVLMDVQMPDMSGHEATRRLRERYGASLLPIVALTAAAVSEARQQALDAGMNDFLTKPIDPQHLQATLTRFLPEVV